MLFLDEVVPEPIETVTESDSLPIAVLLAVVIVGVVLIVLAVRRHRKRRAFPEA